MRFSLRLGSLGFIGAIAALCSGVATPSGCAQTALTSDVGTLSGESQDSTYPVLNAIIQDPVWLNTSRALTLDDLKGRIVLLDFWTFCCINCMHIIPDLHALEAEFGKDLTVIGVHSAKFENEKDTDNIRSAILRYEVSHPVVNDSEFKIWQSFGVNSWPTLLLINPEGKIEKVYAGEGHREDLRSNISALKAAYQDKKLKINNSALPISLEREKAPTSVLSFPGKLAYDPDDQLLFISDSNHHRIVAARLNGEIAYTIGREGMSGKQDGEFDESVSGAEHGPRFLRPQGLLYRNHLLYIADTENHVLRQADLKTKKVTTLAGTGFQGSEREPKNAPALTTPLSSPWALGMMSKDLILIAMAGNHQLWTYDIAKKTVSVVAGNGREFIDDGKYPNNSLSQPSGMSVMNRGKGGLSSSSLRDQVYFVDSETSSLRVFQADRDSKNGSIKTLVGSGLFDFGFQDGKRGEGKLQHPLGVWADDSGVYVADTYNHSIRKYDPKTERLETLAGNGKKGFRDGELSSSSFYEPGDLIRIQGVFYIADTNNHQIRVLDPVKKTVSTLMTYFPQPKSLGNFKNNSKESAPVKSARKPQDYLPRLKKTDKVLLQEDSRVSFKIVISPGWEINKKAPSWLVLYEKLPTGEYSFVKEYKQPDLAKMEVEFSPLKNGITYRFQTTLYYCKEGVGALCNIQSRDQEFSLGGGSVDKIAIELN